MNKITAFLIAVIMVINVVASMGVTAHAQNYELVNPISGQVQGTGNDHAGVDIFAPLGTPIYAVSSGYIQYSERGHTHDYGKSEDTPNSVKIVMDTPIQYNGLTYTNAFYTHLSELVYDVHDGEPLSIHVNAGDLIGYSGCGNGVNHLHFSFEWVNPNNDNDWQHMTTDEVISAMGWSRSKWITALDRTTFNNNSQGNEYNPYVSTLTFAQIKNKFPQGKYWNNADPNVNNPDGYSSTPCTCHKQGICEPDEYPCRCNHFDGATQCWGFVNKLGYDMYGSHVYSWTKKESDAAYYINNSLKPGDIVRYGGHSIMVTNVSGSTVTVAECNWSARCIISYSRTVSKSTLISSVSWVSVAPNSNPFTGGTTPPPSTNVDTRYNVPMKAYPLSSADHAATAYDSINGSSIGYIYGSDYCTINKVYENGWCQVTCPWDSSTKTVYTQTSAFIQDTSYQVSSLTANARATTYIRSTGSSTLGYIDPGDRITIVGKSGDRTQIIYPHTDGVYRMAWVNNSDLVHSHSYGSWTYADGSSHKRSCSCGDVQWGDHSWNSGTVTTSATCTSNGIRTYTCTVCNGTKTETISALGHNYTGSYRDDTVHPHSEYKLCTRCDEKQYTGNTSKVEGCPLCYPTSWNISSDGVLTISGVGKMDEYNYTNSQNPPPWASQRDRIKAIVVKEGITTIGGDAFSGCNKATSITIPNSVVTIGCWSLNGCNGLTNIYISANVTTMEGYVFNDCQNLKDIYCQAASKPAGWVDNWLGDCKATVHWGCSNNPLTCNHSYGAWTSVDKLNHKHICSLCGKTETVAHTWNSGAVTTQPTCTASGTKTYACTACSEAKTETVPALGHNYSGDYWDTAHPHAEYQLCTRCNDRKDTGETGKDNDCPICNPELGSTDAKIVVGNASGRKDNTISVPISIKNNPGIYAICFEMPIDPNVFEYVGCEYSNSIFKLDNLSDYDPTTNSFKLNRSGESLFDNVTIDGIIAIIKLRIKNTVSDGTYALSVKVDALNTINCDGNGVNVSDGSGVVSVSSYRLGDVDGDGSITNKDVLLMKKYIFNKTRYPLPCQMIVADINGDNECTNADILRINRNIFNKDKYPLER